MWIHICVYWVTNFHLEGEGPDTTCMVLKEADLVMPEGHLRGRSSLTTGEPTCHS